MSTVIQRKQRRGPSPDATLDEKLAKARRRAHRNKEARDHARQVARELRERVRRLRERSERLNARLERTEGELSLLREFTLDVFPKVEVPMELQEVCDGVLNERLTFLGPLPLRSLVSCVMEAEKSVRPGAIIEAGTALGGSAIAMAAAKSTDRPMYVYDVFGMIPPPSAKDTEREAKRYKEISTGESTGVGGDTYYGYRDDLLGEVTNSFERFGIHTDERNVHLIKGLFQDTIHLDEPVALAHLDGDWYESTMVCLERIAPLVVPGGRIVIDDYHHWTGCRHAVEDFMRNRTDFRVEYRARVHLVKVD